MLTTASGQRALVPGGGGGRGDGEGGGTDGVDVGHGRGEHEDEAESEGDAMLAGLHPAPASYRLYTQRDAAKWGRADFIKAIYLSPRRMPVLMRSFLGLI